MLELRRVRASELDAAAAVIAASMADNPVHVAVWPDRSVRDAALRIAFTTGHRRRHRWVLGAFDAGELVAVAGIGPHGSCLPTPRQARTLARRLGPAAERYRAWRGAWAANDPAEEHVHFGPFGVRPDRQSRGIGAAVVARHCEDLDRAGVLGYLEADRADNLPFYERYGFRVVGEEDVLGVRCWYLSRRPGLGTA